MKLVSKWFTYLFLLSSVTSATVSFSQVLPPLPQNELILPPASHTIPFRWLSDSAGARWEPFAALLIPVKLKGCPKQFYMQFDTGSPFTVFYKNKVLSIQKKYPRSITTNDSLNVAENCSLQTGTMSVSAKKIQVRPYGNGNINWKSDSSVDIIGTFGSDFLDNRITLIDYPKRRMTSAPAAEQTILPNEQRSDFLYMNRTILFPTVIKGKRTILYFDSGSSAFELLTDSTTYEALSKPSSSAHRYSINNWGRTMVANSKPANDSVLIGGKQVRLNEVSFMQGTTNKEVAQMMKMGIGGMTGNKLFLNYALLIDTKNKKFAVLPSSSK